MIPRRLIVTEKALSLLSHSEAECFERMHVLHPSFEIQFFSDKRCQQFVRSFFPGMIELYQSYPLPVQKADLFRILAVLELGGFYFDLDVQLRESIEPLCHHDLVLTEERELTRETYLHRYHTLPKTSAYLKQIGNYGFGARAGHPFLRGVLREIVARTSEVDFFEVSEPEVYYSTGPDVFTYVYHENPNLRNSASVLLHGITEVNGGRSRFAWAKPEWFQFGHFGTHLMLGTWKALSPHRMKICAAKASRNNA